MYVCMNRMGVPLQHTSVPMLGLGLVGAAPLSCSTYVLGGSVTLAFRNACTRRLFDFVYNFECDLFAFYCFKFLFAAHLGVLRPYTWFTSSFRPLEFGRVTSFRMWSTAGSVIRTFSGMKLILGKRSRHPSGHQPSSSRGLCWWELSFRPLSGRSEQFLSVFSIWLESFIPD